MPHQTTAASRVRTTRCWAEDFAHVVAAPGAEARLLTPKNHWEGTTDIRRAVNERRAFFVEARADLLVLDGDGPLARLDAELLATKATAMGLSPVIVRSGHPEQPWRRHVFVRVVGRPRERLKKSALRLGRWDVREGSNAIRPPLSVHRLGGASEIIQNTSTGEPMELEDALAALSPTPRALSSNMLRVIRYGQRRREYRSRSEADQAVACSIVNAGGCERDLRVILGDPKNKVGKKYREKKARSPRAARTYLHLTWTHAQDFVAANPVRRPTEKQEKARREIRKMEAVAANTPRRWRGASGATDRNILRFLHGVGFRKGDVMVGGAVRTIAEGSSCSTSSAWRGCERLCRDGWLRKIKNGLFLSGSEWELLLPTGVEDGTLMSSTDNLNSNINSLGGGVSNECSVSCVLCLSVWRKEGLGARRREVYAILAACDGLLSKALAQWLGVQQRAAQNHLSILGKHGLARRESDGEWVIGEKHLHAVARRLGLVAHAKRDQRKHRNERSDFAKRVQTSGRGRSTSRGSAS